MSHKQVKIYNILFAGTPSFAQPIFKILQNIPHAQIIGVITQPDKPVGRSQTITQSPIKLEAATAGLPVFQPTSLRHGTIVKKLQSLKPDIGIVVAYGKIIPPAVLTIPGMGWLNVHASLLPAYRGAAPIQAAILNGDNETGVTVMRLDEGLDTGPILYQKKIALEKHITSEKLHDQLADLGAHALQESLLPYLQGRIQPRPQATSGVSITKPIRKEDGLINWEHTAESIERAIRAYTPWPGAYTFWNGARLILKKVHVLSQRNELKPGQVQLHNSVVYVGTGLGTITIDSLQREGRKIQSIRTFILGAPTIDGTRFTND